MCPVIGSLAVALPMIAAMRTLGFCFAIFDLWQGEQGAFLSLKETLETDTR